MIEYEVIHVRNYYNQNDYKVTARNEEGVLVGRLTYCEYENKIMVDLVEVWEPYQGKGIAKEMYKAMHEKHKNDCEFERAGFYTEEGARIRNWFEREILKREA